MGPKLNDAFVGREDPRDRHSEEDHAMAEAGLEVMQP